MNINDNNTVNLLRQEMQMSKMSEQDNHLL